MYSTVKYTIVHPSRTLFFFLLSFLPSSGPGDKPRYPTPQQHTPAPRGGLRDIPNSQSLWQDLCWPLGLFPSGTCPENLQRVASWRDLKQIPERPQLTPFEVKEQQPYFEHHRFDRWFNILMFLMISNRICENRESEGEQIYEYR